MRSEADDTEHRVKPKVADEREVQELRLLLQELRLNAESKKEHKTTNPLALAILGGILTALLAIVNSFASWYSTHSLEQNKFEQGLIGDALKAPDAETRRTNFAFLLDSGLVADPYGRLRRTFAAIPVDQTPSFPTAPINNAIPSVEVGAPHEVDVGHDYLNLRAGPGPSYLIIGRLTSGDLVTPIGSAVAANGEIWVPVRVGDHVAGWVTFGYLRPVKKNP